MRESLKIMSLNRWSYGVSFFLTQGFFAIFTSLMLFISFYISLTVGEGGIEKNQWQYFKIFMGMLLFGLNLVALTMAMSATFTDSKISTQIGIFVLFLPSSVLIYIILSIIADSMTSAIVDFEPYYGEQQLPYWYILPHFTYGMILLDFLTDDGIPKMAFKLLMPHDMRIV